MKRLGMVLLVLMATLSLVDTASADDRHRVRFEGVIAQLTDHGMVVHTRRGDVHVAVTPDTRVSLNGEQVRFGALKVRDHVMVAAHWVKRGDRRVLIADGIRARRRR